ncbi:uncharacterized protein BROUX77_006945 [Berkeleyomyces rouxiae]|uniref:uncharacterized protein n=1 Tax=Berkeleyomyces rouxiae TaxID=2035830 RepID=UPI003B76CA69
MMFSVPLSPSSTGSVASDECSPATESPDIPSSPLLWAPWDASPPPIDPVFPEVYSPIPATTLKGLSPAALMTPLLLSSLPITSSASPMWAKLYEAFEKSLSAPLFPAYGLEEVPGSSVPVSSFFYCVYLCLQSSFLSSLGFV